MSIGRAQLHVSFPQSRRVKRLMLARITLFWGVAPVLLGDDFFRVTQGSRILSGGVSWCVTLPM